MTGFLKIFFIQFYQEIYTVKVKTNFIGFFRENTGKIQFNRKKNIRSHQLQLYFWE